ncbi:Syntaxin/t-SNARE family protein [Rhynchospora pubera]|uniref:Syntaxin/t-SNARE family protein n=1 Tax=Rhynchospora pubera TaxID=906938 RepID=A0AAV8CV00_9POAL|nr:Syntaxin/t-SNARE family protein [Rhynchospora pubera]
MGESYGYGRWEVDPLFSAAEVVQDSADRMESIHRLLLHEEKLLQSQTSTSDLMASVQYHKRDLATAVETTRWQLEDFARAVDYATLSDKSNSRKNAILKFNQFIQAIRGQIFEAEKNLNDTYLVDTGESSRLLNSTDHETDELASFLSGTVVNTVPHVSHEPREPENGIMRYDSPTNNHDEILEITEEIAPSNEVESSWAGTLDLESGNSGAKYYPYKNGVIRPNWNLLRKFWHSSRSRESFTKRQKDGEIMLDTSESPLSINGTPVEKYHMQYNHYRIPVAKTASVSLLVLGLLVLLFHVA